MDTPAIVVKTYVHLQDNKNWRKICFHDGHFDFGGMYLERRRPDRSKPFGELIKDDNKYEYDGEVLEHIESGNYVKHLYFRQMPQPPEE